jgi:hypothetical protein
MLCLYRRQLQLLRTMLPIHQLSSLLEIVTIAKKYAPHVLLQQEARFTHTNHPSSSRLSLLRQA